MHQYHDSGEEEDISDGEHHYSSSSAGHRSRGRRHHSRDQQQQQQHSIDGNNDDDHEEETGDSLDIKPPQAKRSANRKRREHSTRDSSHSRHSSAGASSNHHHQHQHPERRKEDKRYNHQQQQQQQQQHKHRRYDDDRQEGKRKQRRYDQQPYQRSKEPSAKQSAADHHMQSQQHHLTDPDRLLEADLRSRLLSKRKQYETSSSVKDEYRHETRPHYPQQQHQQQQQQQPPPHHHRQSGGDRRSSHADDYYVPKKSSKKSDHRERDIIELIDSPENYNDHRDFYAERVDKERRSKPDQNHHHQHDHQHHSIDHPSPRAAVACEPGRVPSPEDEEVVARRSKLLAASRRKEMAREQLEARRELRRDREAAHGPIDDDEEEEGEIERKRSRRDGKRSKKTNDTVSVSDDASDDDGGGRGGGEDGASTNDDDESGEEQDDDDSNSNSDSGSEEDEDEEAEENSEADDSKSDTQLDLPGSPLSVGDLAKSDRSREEEEGGSSRSRDSDRSQRQRRRRRQRSDQDSDEDSRSRSRTRSRSRSRSSRTPDSDEEDSTAEQREEDDDGEGRRQAGDRRRDNLMEQDVDEAELKRVLREREEDDKRKEQEAKLPNYFPALQGCRSVEEFFCLNRIEEGTYGVVYRAKDKRTEEVVALKRLKMEKEKEGFPITSLREINTLLKGQHPNIVTVREIVVGSNMDRIYIVMDYVEHDMKSLMDTMKHKKQTFLPGEVKCLLSQLLLAVGHLHDNWILHRDLKTSNLLLSHKGILKVGDFGLAREYGSPLKPYTSVVVTLWYRAPELLLGCKEYSTPIDMWSVGCIFAEFLSMAALFPGKSEVDQLNRIFKDLGTPNETIWKGYSDLPVVKRMNSFAEHPVSKLRRNFSHYTSELGLALLQGLLTYDPKKRFTADVALKESYFKELPLPIDPAMFPTWPAKSELGARKALASSPKPPSGGGQFKQLGGDDNMERGFHLGGASSGAAGHAMTMENRQLSMGPGFSLKF